MDRQAFFNDVVTHLRKQNRRATQYPNNDNATGCSYLMENGDKCAIGSKIPDGHPGQKFIGNVDSLLTAFPDLGALWNVVPREATHYSYSDLYFLRDLQSIHDHNLPDMWEDEFERAAKRFDLVVPPNA